ncbi:MAG: hypothetical protein ACWA40_08340 [Planktomarina sp.]
MDGLAVIAIICAAILGILLWRAISVVKSEQNAPRGTLADMGPDAGETEIISEYSSGVGGGERRTYTIPKDPQKYAQVFVPRDQRTKDT